MKLVCESLNEFYQLNEDWKTKIAKGIIGAALVAGTLGGTTSCEKDDSFNPTEEFQLCVTFQETGTVTVTPQHSISRISKGGYFQESLQDSLLTLLPKETVKKDTNVYKMTFRNQTEVEEWMKKQMENNSRTEEKNYAVYLLTASMNRLYNGPAPNPSLKIVEFTGFDTNPMAIITGEHSPIIEYYISPYSGSKLPRTIGYWGVVGAYRINTVNTIKTTVYISIQ